MKLVGRKVVLTGASGGIGGAIARELAAEGCQLLLTGRNLAKLTELKESLEGNGHSIVTADLNSADGRSSLQKAAAGFGIEVLINGLGVNRLRLLEASKDEDIENILRTNLVVPIQLCQLFLPLLKQHPEAAIVNIGSILGSIGYAGSSLYCASKFGLRSFTESLRRELADTRIKVIYFAPRTTQTELNTGQVQQLNQELGNTVDKTEWVARELIKTLKNGNSGNRYLGRPESFFVRLNSLFPGLAGATLYAMNLGRISEMFDFMGQEVTNAFLQYAIYLLLLIVCMTQYHGSPKFQSRLRVLMGMAMAIVREGGELVVFYVGVMQSGSKAFTAAVSGVIGFAIGMSTCAHLLWARRVPLHPGTKSSCGIVVFYRRRHGAPGHSIADSGRLDIF